MVRINPLLWIHYSCLDPNVSCISITVVQLIQCWELLLISSWWCVYSAEMSIKHTTSFVQHTQIVTPFLYLPFSRGEINIYVHSAVESCVSALTESRNVIIQGSNFQYPWNQQGRGRHPCPGLRWTKLQKYHWGLCCGHIRLEQLQWEPEAYFPGGAC